ncbi:MAG: glycosyltransferase family 39 protein [Candidatus Paceibacterota bacterium]
MDKIKNNFVSAGWRIAAGGLLALMFALSFLSAWDETATFDEVAHIPAGYSYLTQKDMRLNPEHPPLMKDISALPLMFLNLNFPTNIPTWSEKISSRQWDMGKIFLYRAGNDADKIIRLARLPMILLAVLFGAILFYWTRKNYGDKVGFLTLFLFTMSPTIIAHSRYVTTDMAAAFGFFIAIASFLAFLKNQSWRNVFIAGALLGVALLFKFSTVILAPIFFVLVALWWILNRGKILSLLWKIIMIGLIALALVYIVYIFHVWNYPSDLQIKDISDTLSSNLGRKTMPAFAWMIRTNVLKPLAEYLFGVVSVVQRAGGGNASHFMGTVYSEATPWYFPTLYLFKESLIFHILTIIAIFFAIKSISLARAGGRSTFSREWMKNNFTIIASLFFIAFYVFQSITGNLNIGHRHIMPILPFAYFLVALVIAKFNKTILTGILLAVMFISTIVTYPYYLSYYNILAGGTANGYKIATDSNYDWGQDMKRLRDWMDENSVNKIDLHYFGGGDGKYYFGDKYEDWWSSKGQPSAGSWFAISANAREGSIAKPVRGFTIKPDDTYSWLKGKEPVARAGSSIFIYKF